MRDPLPWLTAVSDVPHGGAAPAAALDLSASLAPLGPSPAAVAAARAAAITPYPERHAGSLVTAAAAELGVHRARVVAAAGAGELLLSAMRAHLRPGDAVLVVAPCFGEYARGAAGCGATTVRWSSAHGDGALRDAADVAACARAARAADAALGIVARPANPTGVLTPAACIEALAAATPATTWVVDEAFVGMCDGGVMSVAGGEVITVRSLTKELALAGLRVGVADAPPPVADALRAVLPPWPVSGPAIAAAVAGLGDRAHRAATLGAVRTGREALLATLARAGVATHPSATAYVCAAVGDSAAVAAAFAASGIAVRRCDDLGLEGAIRIAVPPPDRLDEVLQAVAVVLGRAA